MNIYLAPRNCRIASSQGVRVSTECLSLRLSLSRTCRPTLLSRPGRVLGVVSASQMSNSFGFENSRAKADAATVLWLVIFQQSTLGTISATILSAFEIF